MLNWIGNMTRLAYLCMKNEGLLTLVLNFTASAPKVGNV